MSQFFNQYFDVSFMAKHFGEVLDGFRTTSALRRRRRPGAALGAGPGAAAPAPGQAGLIVRVLTIAYIDVFRGIPLLI